MDDLAALEAALTTSIAAGSAHDAASLASGSSGGAGVSGGASHDAYATPQVKRRRRGQRCSPRSSAGHDERHADGDSVIWEDGADPNTPGGGDEAAEDDDAEKQCYGCGRICGVSRGYFGEAATVPWGAHQSKGHWCKDCHTCWRTVFQKSHTLALFGKHIRKGEKAAANFACWERHLIAYLSLVHDKNSRITVGMVTDRMRTLDFVGALLGWSPKHSMVKLLEDGNAPGFDVDPNALVTVRDGGRNRVGVLVPADFTRATPGAMSRAPTSLLLNNRTAIMADKPEDRQLLFEKIGLGNSASAEHALVALDSSATLSPRLTRFQARMEATKTASRMIIENFATDHWEAVKESSLTNLLGKFGDFHSEAASHGHSEDAASALEWHSGLGSGKLFLRLHREYSKTKSKLEKFREFAQPLDDFVQFLVRMHIQPAPTFKLLWLRSLLHEAVATKKTIGAGVTTALAHGLGETLSEVERRAPSAMAGVRFSGDAWLRSVLQRSFGERLQMIDNMGVAEGAKELTGDLKTTIALLQGDSRVSVLCAVAIEDFGFVALTVEASLVPCPISPARVAEALRVLENNRLAGFLRPLTNTSFGKGVIDTATAVMQVSEKDSAGDEALARAHSILMDARMPMLKVSSAPLGATTPQIVVQNAGLILDMSIADMLQESLGCAIEALSLWTPGRVLEMNDKIIDWAKQVMKSLSFYDCALSLHLEAVTTAAGAMQLLGCKPTADDDFEVDGIVGNDSRASSIVELGTLVDEKSVDEAPLARFAKALRSFFLGERPLADSTKMMFSDMAALIDARILSNINCRSTLATLLMCMAQFGDVPKSPKEALHDWKGKFASGRDESSFLSSSLRLQRIANKMHPLAWTSIGEEATIVILELDGESGAATLEASCERASDLSGRFLDTPLVTEVLQLQQKVIQAAVDDLGEHLYLNAIAMPDPTIVPLPAMDDDAAGTLLSSFFVKERAAEPAKIAQKVFATNASKDMQWPVVPLVSMCRQLVDVAPNRSFVVTLDAFCSSTADAPSWSDKAMLKRLFDILVPLSQVAAALIFLRGRIGEDSNIIRDCMLKEEVEIAMSFIKSTTARQMDILATTPLSQQIMTTSWASPAVHGCAAWFAGARKVIPTITKYFLLKVLGHTRDVSMRVHSFTPKIDHICSSEKFVPTLAKKSLLQWPSRAQLNEKTVQLFHILSSISRLATQFGLGDLKVDADLRDDISEAQGIFDAARTAMTAIAATNILTEVRGDDQKAKAQQLLAQKRDQLSKCFLVELERVANS